MYQASQVERPWPAACHPDGGRPSARPRPRRLGLSVSVAFEGFVACFCCRFLGLSPSYAFGAQGGLPGRRLYSRTRCSSMTWQRDLRCAMRAA